MIKSLLVDDEPSARRRMTRLLSVHADIAVAGEAGNGVEALERIQELAPDLVFLDIEVPGLNGFEVLRALPPHSRMPLVVFVTAYDQHALAAFEANALAYLLKPVSPERLATVLERARLLLAHAPARLAEQRHVRQLLDDAPRTLRHIVARKQNRLVLLRPEQIVLFHVDGGIVRAKTTTDSYWVNQQLNELEQALPVGAFFRARREVLVNLSHVRDIQPYFKSSFLLTMADAAHTEVPVSERQAKLFRERLPGL